MKKRRKILLSCGLVVTALVTIAPMVGIAASVVSLEEIQMKENTQEQKEENIEIQLEESIVESVNQKESKNELEEIEYQEEFQNQPEEFVSEGESKERLEESEREEKTGNLSDELQKEKLEEVLQKESIQLQETVKEEKTESQEKIELKEVPKEEEVLEESQVVAGKLEKSAEKKENLQEESTEVQTGETVLTEEEKKMERKLARLEKLRKREAELESKEVLTKEEEDELFDLPVKIQGIELECGLYDYKADIYVMQNTTEAAINDMQRDLDTMELPEEIVADLQNRIKHLTPVYEKYKAVMEEADRHPDADYKEISRSLYAEMQVVWEIINK